jgi:hypothetical protein
MVADRMWLSFDKFILSQSEIDWREKSALPIFG